MSLAGAVKARVAAFAARSGRRLVVKVGSSLLVEPDGSIRRRWLESLVADIAGRRQAGQEIIVVSSGAVALGSRRLGLAKGGRASLEDAQASAAVGQILLAGLYAELLGGHGLAAAQMLVTLGDLEDRRRYLNAAATLERLLTLGAIPILNENDSVATEEIRFGDNDRLAARVAQAAQAHALMLLSDIDGLYSGNPHRDASATLLPTVHDIAEVAHMADRGTASGMGSGGMVAKLEAARIAHAAGVPVAIVAGKPDHPLSAFDATGHGTIFLAPDALTARKAWLAGRLTVAGRLHVDAGAANALKVNRSLLAAGITGLEGDFRRGDAVEVVSPAGAPLARGLVSYDSGDLARIAGRRSDAIEGILGYAPRGAVVHRDQMVML